MIEKFLKKAKWKNDCLEWTGGLNKDGYGLTRFLGRTTLAHRTIAELSGWDIEGKIIMHSCDNPKCVNINHLSIGTIKNNVEDRDRKNRQAKGERLGISKLKDYEVFEIRRIAQDGSLTHSQIARFFKVSQSTVTKIVNKKMWAHL